MDGGQTGVRFKVRGDKCGGGWREISSIYLSGRNISKRGNRGTGKEPSKHYNIDYFPIPGERRTRLSELCRSQRSSAADNLARRSAISRMNLRQSAVCLT